MNKILTLIIFIFLASHSFGQVIGKVTDDQGKSLSSVNIYIENSYKGTTTNGNGNYSLDLNENGRKTIVFQYLGYQTIKKTIDIDQMPFQLDVSMSEETSSLSEVVINSGENPANRIIREAIKNRKKNKAKIKAYTADFYSRGTWTLKNGPKKLLGQQIDYGDMALDSTNSGMIYLSETKSEIKYQAPDNFHEHIIASKVSGNDNGFSLNSAQQANFSFYENTINLNTDIVSPIADYAFNYYRYELADAFYDNQGHLINKIKVIPKRPEDKVFSGYIFIVEDDWEIYGTQLTIQGKATQIPPLREIHFNQSFTYSQKDQLWVKLSQDVNFTWKILGISGTGKFLAVYSNYDFNPSFQKESFGKEILNFADNANKKDSVFEKFRPIPLTDFEAKDYHKRDSISIAHKAKPYLDSVDRVNNKFALSDILFGYSYQNSSKDYSISISSPLLGTHFNTVQGWNLNLNTSFTKNQNEYHRYWKLYTDMSYGFADHRYRINGGFLKKFNDISYPYLKIEGGVKAEQINNTNPIPIRVNDIANIFFERNYLKLYDKQYAQAYYSQELFNGFRFYSQLGFERRIALLNSTDHVIRHDKNGGYTSNNPLNPGDFDSKPFKTHNIGKLKVGFRMKFGQKYFLYPDQKFNVTNDKFPTLYFGYEKGFASNIKDYNFDQLQLSLEQNVDLKNKGNFHYRGKIGKFFHGDKMAFVDYKHFDGNQLRVSARSNYVGKFNLLPYYMLSTNDQYAEAHAEQNFKGWILGKIPGVNKLNLNLVLGVHALWTGGHKPYQEYSIGIDRIGFGKIRFLRVDYMQSIYNGKHMGAVIFGLKFLGLFDN